MNFFRKYTLLILLCLGLLVSHTLYVRATYQYPASGNDEPVYVDAAVRYYDLIRHPTSRFLRDLAAVNPYRQPLYSLFLALPLFLTGVAGAYKTALWVNIIFYTGTIIGTYALGRKFFRESSSLLAAFIFATYGFPLFYLHFAYSETMTSMFVVLSLLFLARSDRFTDIPQTVVFSVTLLLASLTRWVAPLFAAGPLAVSSLRALFLAVTDRRKRKTVLAAAALFAVIGIGGSAAFYYVPYRVFFSQYISGTSARSAEWASAYLGSDYANTFSVKSFMYYFNILSQQTVFFWLLFCSGCLLGLAGFRKYLFLYAAFFVPYFVFTFSSAWKGDRFIVPIYPSMALLSVIPLEYIRGRAIKTVLISLIIGIGSLNFLGSSWGLGPMGKQGLKDIVLPAFIRHPRRIYLTPMVWPPRQDETRAGDIVGVMMADAEGKPFTVMNGFYDSDISAALYMQTAYNHRGLADGVPLAGIPETDFGQFSKNIARTDYILVITRPGDPDLEKQRYRDIGDFAYYVSVVQETVRKNRGVLPGPFTVLKKFTIPMHHDELTVFKRTGTVSPPDLKLFSEEILRRDATAAAALDTVLSTFR